MRTRNKVSVVYILLALLPTTFFLTQCKSHQEGTVKEDKTMLRKIYVDKAEVLDSAEKDDVLKVRVIGNLPSPAYSFATFDVKIDGNVIEITPLAKKITNDMVAQVLVPFDEICRVDNLKKGSYQLKIHCHGDRVLEYTTSK